MQPFQTYLPTPELSPYIKQYMVLEADFGAGIPISAVARGLPVMAFSFRPDGTISWSRNDGRPTPAGSVLFGQTTRTVDCVFWGQQQVIYAVFWPSAMHTFVRQDMPSFTNEDIALDTLSWIARDHTLTEQLAEAPSNARRIEVINTLMTKRLHQLQHYADPASLAVRLIDKHNGSIRVDDVAGYFRMSRRSLERHFMNSVGVSPKQYANILRFRHLMSYLHANPAASWLDLTHLGNFADQSHLIRHIRSFTDLPPASFRALDHRLDKLFLENF